MKNITRLGFAALLVSVAGAVAAQEPTIADAGARSPAARSDSGAKKENPNAVSLFRPLEINHFRLADQRGVNVFEPPKENQVDFHGFVLSLGGAFTQEFQGLEHSNAATPVVVNGVNTNQLMAVGKGFNNAVANLNVNAQIAPGIRIAMTSYLSARHHQESWVKDGYLLVDDSPIDNPLLKSVMKYTTLRVGHFEINYGDLHFRRTDNGNGMYNPFIGNTIVDPFTTEIGAEVYVRANGMLAMLATTSGEVKGQVTAPQSRSMSMIGKAGVDKQFLGGLVRTRLTGSFYANNKAASNTLYTGDRGGSQYYSILENTASTETANAWSGQVRPGFSNKVNAEVINPFVKVGGLELFGSFETATGGAFTEPKLRTLHQNVYEGLFRFANGQLYLGGRYNTVKGQLISRTYDDQTVNRYQLGGGWFVTPNILAKLEYVNQKYLDFPGTDIRNGGRFKGFMVAGTVGF
jgi:hypothetical protein